MVDIDVLASLGRAELVTATQLLVVLCVLAVVLRPLAGFVLRPYASNLRVLPGPQIKHFFWGSDISKASINGKFEDYMLELLKEYGPVCSATLVARRPAIFVGDHRAMNKLLLQTPYKRDPLISKIFERHVGTGLLTTEGAQHRRQRKVAHPAFTMPAVYEMSPILNEQADNLIRRLRRKVVDDESSTAKEYGTQINIGNDVYSAALDIIGAAGFDYRFNSLSGSATSLEHAFHEIVRLIATGTLYCVLRAIFDKPVERVGRLLRLEEQRRLDTSKKVIVDISTELVKRAKASGANGKDLLSLMVRANTSDELKDHQRLGDDELAGLVPIFLMAG
ncbi:hypothetical protein OC844_007896, partial [Tilletia horrida]